jgi:hypothetical protein
MLQRTSNIPNDKNMTMTMIMIIHTTMNIMKTQRRKIEGHITNTVKKEVVGKKRVTIIIMKITPPKRMLSWKLMQSKSWII